MNDKLKIALIAASTALVVVLVIVPFLRGAPGINTIERIIKETVGATAGGDFTNPVKFFDRVIFGRDFFATTTPSALTGHTLGASDFTRPDLLRVVTFGGAVNTDYTYTLPATSTVGIAVVPRVGDREELCFFVQASTSKHALIFAAGTGWDFTIATTTIGSATTTSAGALGIEQNQIGCLDMIREPGIGLGQLGNINAEIEFRSNANDTTTD